MYVMKMHRTSTRKFIGFIGYFMFLNFPPKTQLMMLETTSASVDMVEVMEL